MIRFKVLCVVAVSFFGLPALAQSAQDMVIIAPHLKAIDTIPTKESLDEAFESPAAVLMAAARDQNLSVYERTRAITLLSMFPSQQSQFFMGGLMNDSDPEIRGIAVYTVARTFGTFPNDQTFEIIEKALKDPDESVKS